MVDIHCHILPGVDDGSQNLEDSLAMIAQEVKGGTTAFVATPHVLTAQDLKRTGEFADAAAKLRDALQEAGITAQVVLGAEVYPIMPAIEALDKGIPLTAGGAGKYMLVDLPMSKVPMDFEQFLFELQSRQVTPIIAHPERCGQFQQDPEQLLEYVMKGYALQVNGGSLRGKYGPRATETAEFILGKRWAHFLASDAHRPRSIALLSTSREMVRDELDIDEAYIEILTTTSGQCVIDGVPLPILPPAPVVERKAKKAGLMSRLFGR